MGPKEKAVLLLADTWRRRAQVSLSWCEAEDTGRRCQRLSEVEGGGAHRLCAAPFIPSPVRALGGPMVSLPSGMSGDMPIGCFLSSAPGTDHALGDLARRVAS